MSTSASVSPHKNYPGDISAGQFERIRPLLESFRAKTGPREVDLHHVFNAVLHVLLGGLPVAFPPP